MFSPFCCRFLATDCNQSYLTLPLLRRRAETAYVHWSPLRTVCFTLLLPFRRLHRPCALHRRRPLPLRTCWEPAGPHSGLLSSSRHRRRMIHSRPSTRIPASTSSTRVRFSSAARAAMDRFLHLALRCSATRGAKRKDARPRDAQAGVQFLRRPGTAARSTLSTCTARLQGPRVALGWAPALSALCPFAASHFVHLPSR